MEPYLAIIKRIKDLMKEEELNLYKLSNKSGLPHSSVSNVVNGKTKNTGILSIINICRGLDISVVEFFQSELFAPENLSDD